MSDTFALSLSHYRVTAEQQVYDIHDDRYGQPYLRLSVSDMRGGCLGRCRDVTVNGELTPIRIADALRLLADAVESAL